MKDFLVQDVSFKQRTGPPVDRGHSDDDGFVLVKSDSLLDFYTKLRELQPKDIMEVGMYEGGSLVLFDRIYNPTTLVGVDARAEPIDALEAYKATRPHIKTFYGQYQEQPSTRAIAEQCFPNGIDLIIDDASHLYPQTIATFDMLFPLVRPGGHYVIEDWQWSHQPGRQDPGSPWFDRPALTNLIFELVIHTGHSDSIESIHVDGGVACVQRGRGDHVPLEQARANRLRGRALEQI